LTNHILTNDDQPGMGIAPGRRYLTAPLGHLV
jgi:hypothetical protein